MHVIAEEVVTTATIDVVATCDRAVLEVQLNKVAATFFSGHATAPSELYMFERGGDEKIVPQSGKYN